MKNIIKIWERQPDEPEAIYHLLEEYLCQVGKRSYDYTAAVTGKSKRTIERYAAKWNWVKRANAYDDYIRHNHKLGFIEYCQEMERQKFFLKMELSTIAQEVYNRLKVYLEFSETAYSNPEIVKQLKFYNEIATTAKKVYSLINFEPHHEISIEKFKQDVANNKNDLQQMDCDPKFKISEFQDFKHFFNYFSSYIKDKNEKIYEKCDIQQLETRKTNNDNNLEENPLSVIYSEPASPGDNYLEEYNHRKSKT